MKIYTRTGDNGTTSLVGGTRVEKDNIRLEAYGTVDELNSWLGLLSTSEHIPQSGRRALDTALSLLFDIGGSLATEPTSPWQPEPFPVAAVEMLEESIDAMEADLPCHDKFILPGGHPDAARANIARTVARRAERHIVALSRQAPVDAVALKYINRLSDWLFVLGRAINHTAGVSEVFWESPKSR